MATEYIRCTNCKGMGRVPNEYGSGKWMTCPVCKGAGKKVLHKDQKKSKQGGLKNVNNQRKRTS